MICCKKATTRSLTVLTTRIKTEAPVVVVVTVVETVVGTVVATVVATVLSTVSISRTEAAAAGSKDAGQPKPHRRSVNL